MSATSASIRRTSDSLKSSVLPSRRIHTDLATGRDETLRPGPADTPPVPNAALCECGDQAHPSALGGSLRRCFSNHVMIRSDTSMRNLGSRGPWGVRG